MERIGAVQLGELTDKRFLTGIIPNTWDENVYENDNFWTCKCSRNPQTNYDTYNKNEKEFDIVYEKIKEEFKEHLMEIYSISSCGDSFVVYLRK